MTQCKVSSSVYQIFSLDVDIMWHHFPTMFSLHPLQTGDLFIGIWVGIWILRQVKGQNLTDDAVSLLRTKEKKNMATFLIDSGIIVWPMDIKSESVVSCHFTVSCTYLRVDPNQGVSLGVELLFQRDHDGLEILHWLILYVVSYLCIQWK